MTDLIFFLGRFHVLALHLPIGMLLLTVGLDFMSRRSRYHYLAQALPLCWGATAISAVLTVVLGLMHFSEGGFEGASVSAHRNYGIGVAGVSLIVWFISAKLPALYGQMRLVSNLLLLFLVAMTGHYGGNLTHGSTYLVEYAPQSIRTMAGLEPRRAEVSDIALADPWYDIVHPMLQSRCNSCHNNDKQSGQLNLNSLETLLLGGKSGSSVVSGDAENSGLFSRISLPENHEDFMPAEGKTPLTESQREIIRWWINAGLPVDTTVADISPAGEVLHSLTLELGLENTSMLQVLYPPVANETLMSLLNLGWLIRPLSQKSNGLIISALSKGQAVSREMLQALSRIRDSVVEINLASSGLSNESLVELTDFPVLEKLNLSNNSIGDAGMDALSSIASLQLLNLYGNPQISDAGLSSLSVLNELDTVYLWGTGVTPEGVERLAAALPGLSIQSQSLMLQSVGNVE